MQSHGSMVAVISRTKPTLMSSIGDVTAAARPPLKEPDRTFISREGFTDSPHMTVLIGV